MSTALKKSSISRANPDGWELPITIVGAVMPAIFCGYVGLVMTP